ncbi:MAG: hypothetical protein AB7P34_04555 [Vicinamibacterales bacterium]
MSLAIVSFMTMKRFEIVLKSARPIAAALMMIGLLAGSASAQSGRGPFSGLYVGADAGRQHIIGGSLVDDVDTLQEDSRIVASVFGGVRGQFRGFVLGAELGFGRTDGDLVLADSSRQLTVDYINDSQWNWTLNAGHTIGPRTLLFGYVSEVTRQFDVTLLRAGVTTEQRDEQGLLRFGGGIEQRIAGPLRLRATIGTSRADFGDRQTNIEIGRRLDASIGLVLQF